MQHPAVAVAAEKGVEEGELQAGKKAGACRLDTSRLHAVSGSSVTDHVQKWISGGGFEK